MALSGSVIPQDNGLWKVQGFRSDVCKTQAVKLGEHRVMFTGSIIPALNGLAVERLEICTSTWIVPGCKT